MDKILAERVKEHYAPLLKTFRETLLAKHPEDAYEGMSELFLPAWGKAYERAPLKMAIVGLETYGWGDNLSVTLEKIGAEDWKYVLGTSKFQDLAYTQWGAHRYTFWGFAMFFLASLYGVRDWNVLKQRAHADILSQFVWGNVHALEQWPLTDMTKTDWQAWKDALDAAASFNTFTHLQALFAPRVTIVMCARGECDAYLAGCAPTLQWERDNVRLFKVGEDYVFNVPHPTNMKFNYGADAYAKTIREALQDLGLSQSLPEFVNT